MKAAHCPENCCSQTFDWKLFSRCHQLVRDEVLCQSLFVCKVCRASDNSSLLTALHRKCQRCVTLSVTRTSSSNHQVTLLTHQPPKEFKVPVCGRTLRRNDAAEFMFGAVFFSPHSWLKWKCFVFSDNTTWVFFSSADIIFLEPTGKFGADCDSKDSKTKYFVWIWLMFRSLSLVENVVCCARSQTVWSSVIWLHVMIAKLKQIRGIFEGLSNLWGLDSFHVGDQDEL